MNLTETAGLIAAVVMPLWNIPLILRIQERRSSGDISLLWTVGVWACILMMAPAGVRSPDPAFRAFTWMNLLFFSAVVVQVFRFRRP
jgi:hypothetical protein